MQQEKYTQKMNDDMWRLLRGGLPCLETSAVCLQQLLKEIDTRIAEANSRIDEAKARNQKSIQLAILTPALQYSCSQLDALQIISSHVGARHCRALTSVLDSTDNRY